MEIRRNDTVVVIAGRERGKRGKVRRTLPKAGRVVVEGVNIVKRHMKARPPARQAGIVDLEAPLHASNVMLVCTKCNRPTRVGHRFLEDGRKGRVCKRCGELVD